MTYRRGPRVERTLPGDATDPHGLTRAGLDYLERLGVRHYSPRTVEDRRRALEMFISWCAERGITRPQAVTRPVLESYQRHLFHHRKANGAPLSAGTQSARLVPVRALFRHLVRAGVLVANPAADLELPRLDHRLPKATLTAAEAEAVLAAPDLSTPLGLRDRAILEVLYSCGIRRAEAIALGLWDIDAERATLMVRRGKGARDRMVPIGERAVAWVAKYLADARPHLVCGNDPGVLFLTRDGAAITSNRMSQLVAEHIDAAGLTKHGSCHLFRHTMATLMLDAGADIRHIQAILGHAELSTTALYTQVAIRRLQAVHAATHPAAANTRHRGPDHDVDDDARAALLATLAAEVDAEVAEAQGADPLP